MDDEAELIVSATLTEDMKQGNIQLSINALYRDTILNNLHTHNYTFTHKQHFVSVLIINLSALPW